MPYKNCPMGDPILILNYCDMMFDERFSIIQISSFFFITFTDYRYFELTTLFTLQNAQEEIRFNINRLRFKPLQSSVCQK